MSFQKLETNFRVLLRGPLANTYDALEVVLDPFFTLCHKPSGRPPNKRDMLALPNLEAFRKTLTLGFGEALHPRPRQFENTTLVKKEQLARRVLAMQVVLTEALKNREEKDVVDAADDAMSGRLDADEW